MRVTFSPSVASIMSHATNASPKLGYAHYLCFPDDGRRHEIIDGGHYVNPAPSPYHQTISKRLQYQLYTDIELAGLGLLFYAPIDVQLTEHDIVQPDLVGVLSAKKSMITPTKIKGTPDLIVEIISPSSSSTDRTLKRDLYQRTGVAEYWIVDPFEHVLEQLILTHGVYEARPPAELVQLSIVAGVSVKLSDVW